MNLNESITLSSYGCSYFEDLSIQRAEYWSYFAGGREAIQLLQYKVFLFFLDFFLDLNVKGFISVKKNCSHEIRNSYFEIKCCWNK